MSPTRPYLPAIVAAVLIGALGACGCDDARYRAEIGSSAPSSFQDRALRTIINARGLESAYRVEHPQGVTLASPTATVATLGADMAVGPLSEQVPVDRWQVRPAGQWLEVSFEATQFSVVVSARIGQGAGARICRYAVDADRIEVSGQVVVSDNDTEPRVVSTGEPDIEWLNPSVTRIGQCPPLQEADPAEVEQMFIDYVQSAWVRSTRDAISLSPLDALGLIRGRAAIERVSTHENRRGELHLASRVNADNGARTGTASLQLDIDMASSGKRAACAPPLGAAPPLLNAADPIPPSLLENSGAHAGMALASSMLVRFAQISALSGFACRGLERTGFDGSGSNIATDDLMLERVGLGHLPLGAWVEPVISPGGLPRLEETANDVLAIHWPNITIDLYAQMQDVPVRIAQLTTSLEVWLRPQAALDGVELAVDAITVSDAALQSQWLDEQPFDADLLGWSERIALMVLEDTLSLPLPLEPGAPLHLIDAQVRGADVLLLFEFDVRPF